MRTRRGTILVFATLVLLGSSVATAQEYDLLFTAIVASDLAPVHSGPGKSHYATHRLPQNSLVNVYREDPGGWYMIQPPEKSFSLIPAASAKMLSDEVAEITAEGVDAWVGTSLGPVKKPMSQLRLKSGQRVGVIGEVNWPNPGGKPIVWLQIEPPAGEYRWIHRSQLQVPPKDQSSTNDAATNSESTTEYSEPPFAGDSEKSASRIDNVAPYQRGDRSQMASFETPAPSFTQNTSSASSSGWKASSRPLPKSNNRHVARSDSSFGGDGRFPEDRSFDDSQGRSFDDDQADPRFTPWNGQNSRPPRFASLDSMDRQVRSLPSNFDSSVTLLEIEERLSAEMKKDPENWNLADLKFQAERLRATSNDAVERLALQHLVDKLSRCENLSRKFQRVSPINAATNPVPDSMNQYATQYDATGWLKQLANSKGAIDPSYVLQDSSGRVTHRIKGITGMNLGRYVDRKIGVFGKLGINLKFGVKQIVAERIVDLK